MATSFSDPPRAAGPHAHTHSHGHGNTRSQHRKAAPSRTGQAQLLTSLNGILSGPASDQQVDDRHQRHDHANGHSHSHSQQPNSAVRVANDNRSPKLSWDNLNASPPIEQRPNSLAFSYAPPQKPSVQFADTYNYSSEDESLNMAAEDLRHLVADETNALSRDWITIEEVIAAVLVPLPYALSALLFRPQNQLQLKFKVDGATGETHMTAPPDRGSLRNPRLTVPEVSAVVTLTLVLMGIYGYVRVTKQGHKKDADGRPAPGKSLFSLESGVGILERLLSLGLPFYAISQLGAIRVGAFLLAAVMGKLLCHSQQIDGAGPEHSFLKAAKSHRFLLGSLVIQAATDVAGFSPGVSAMATVCGYLALGITILKAPVPYPAVKWRPSSNSSPRAKMNGKLGNAFAATKVPPLVSNVDESRITLTAAAVSALITIFLQLSYGENIASSGKAGAVEYAITAGTMTCSLLFSNPSRLRSRNKVGLILALMIPCVLEYFAAAPTLITCFISTTLAAGVWFGTLLDARFSNPHSNQFHRLRGNSIRHDHHDHHDHKKESKKSPAYDMITQALLRLTVNWPIVHSILQEDDSRPVFYFMLLNFAFMGVQTFYAIVTGSLGLLSDSIHMFFDCLALSVGLAAAVMSKWPPSLRFPYGFGKMNTLSGFANGVFLMLISVEIIYEAVERLMEGSKMHRLGELFIVSVLGFAVNMVGLFSFHHHHDHSHGGHSHAHDHSNHSHVGHEHENSHSHEHHDHDHDHHENSHSHAHENNHGAHSHTAQLSNGLASPMLPSPSPLSPIDLNTNSPSKPSRLNPLAQHLRSNSNASLPSHTHDTPILDHSHTPSHSQASPATGGHSHHGHHHDNENMQGIFLHVLADALGSVAVIISTACVHYTGWAGFDPIASVIIAVLIFISAVPLTTSCAKRLLLAMPESAEFDLRNTLAGVGELRGVVGVCVPRFWLVEGGAEGDDSDGAERVCGVMHVVAARGEEMEAVKARADRYLKARGMDVLVQAEREGEGRCWCGGGLRTG